MTTKPSPTRRKFAHEWDEIQYLYLKLLYWFYDRKDHRRALRFGDRLAKLLKTASPDHQVILGEECWSLIWELKGDLSRAIGYRENEIRLIKELWRISEGTPNRDFALKHYEPSDLSDRYDLLAILYRDAGNLDKALSLLEESKRLCEAHGVRFDGKDLLRDFLRDKKQAIAQNKEPPVAKKTRKLA